MTGTCGTCKHWDAWSDITFTDEHLSVGACEHEATTVPLLEGPDDEGQYFVLTSADCACEHHEAAS